jgi:glycosyltransferase involved in cell wall biosynthesis
LAAPASACRLAEAGAAAVASLAVVMITYNEERHIRRALEAVASIAAEIYVIDSGSSDMTVAIARAHGAVVLEHPFVSHARQFQWALDNAPIRADWIMRLDADEVVEPDLCAALAAQLPRIDPDVVGISLNRKHVFLGRWIRHGGRYPIVLLRIWRRGHGRIENRWMDEHIIIFGGRSVTIEGGFVDHNLNDLTFFTEKHNRYATREAVDRLAREFGLFIGDSAFSGSDCGAQARRKRRLKESLYNRLPFGVGPLCYFLWRYVARLGFLDGWEGLIYHFLQGFWYRFLVEAKVSELRRALSHSDDPVDMRSRLGRLTGLNLE